MADVKDEIAKNILYYRKKKGLTQKALADTLGVKHNAISAWESGTNSIDMDTLFNMCRIFEISISEVFGVYGKTEDEISSSEYEYIKKYRDLDDHGRETVDMILDRETERTATIRDLKSKAGIITNGEMRQIWDTFPKSQEELERLYPPVDPRGIKKEIG